MSSDGFFCGYDDDLFEEMESSERRATKQERQELYAFIGGFRHWTQLDVPLRMHVIGYLEYWDRCNLSLCSKRDNRLVNGSVLISSKDVNQKDGGMRMKPRNLAVLCKSDYEQENTQNVDIERVELGELFFGMRTSSGMFRSWKFVQNKENCTVVCNSSMEDVFAYTKVFTIENGNAEEEFTRKVEKTVEAGKDSIRDLDIHAYHVRCNMPAKLPNLRSVYMDYGSSEHWQWWMNRICVDRPLDSFRIVVNREPRYTATPFDEYPFDDVALPMVLNAKDLRLECSIVISDEQFLSLRAPKLMIESARQISCEALEEYVRRWVDSSEDDFKYCFIRFEEDARRPHYVFTEFPATEYDVRNPPSRHRAFFAKFPWHWRRGSFFQVSKRNDPFNSVSVLMNSERFEMIRTGFPCIREGRPDVELIYTDYHDRL